MLSILNNICKFILSSSSMPPTTNNKTNNRIVFASLEGASNSASGDDSLINQLNHDFYEKAQRKSKVNKHKQFLAFWIIRQFTF